MTQPSPASPAPAPAPRPVVLVTLLGTFIVALDISIVNLAFPSIGESFPDASASTLSWVLSGYSVVFGSLLLTSGRIADRSGRKLVFFGGVALFTAASVACAAAPTVWVLIAARLVQAAGGAMVLPASLGLLLAASAPDARPRLVATWAGVSALAIATGPSIGALLVEYAGWRSAFLINVPVAAVAWLVGRRAISESALGGPMPDLVGVATLSLMVAALALGITKGDEWGWTSPSVLAAFAVGIALAPIAVARSATHPSPALDLSIFKSRIVASANVATLVYSVGFFAMLLSNVLFLTSVWGYSTLKAGLAITPAPLFVALLSSRAGRLAGRIGFRPVALIGTGLSALAMLAFVAVVDAEPRYLAAWLVPSLIMGAGIAFTFPVLAAAAVSELPPDRFAVGSAANQTARQLGAVLGVAALVSVLGDLQTATAADAVDRFHLAWGLIAVTSLASAAVASLLQRPAPAAAPVAVASS